MNAPFDTVASAYDREFTFSRIGMAQRSQVWSYLEPVIQTPAMHVLELNCGTGTDAIHLAKHGHHVTATDISNEMLKAAKEKVVQCGMEDRVTLERMAFNELGQRRFPMAMDLIFSDLGGLNCVDGTDLAQLLQDAASKLKPGGRFIGVLMPDRCVAETIYFLLKGNFYQAFRRGRMDPIWAGLSGSGVVTWYHSPERVAALAKPRFRVVDIRPIGFFVPPSYLEPRFHDKKRTVRFLSRLDRRIAGFRAAARYSDHYLIDLELRS